MGMPPTGEHLLSIGEFSRLSQISVRMLRYYGEHDVLRATHVDPWTGYRSYAPGLLRTARWVLRLRDLGLGVAEIATCVPLLDHPAALRAVLERQHGRLVDEASAALTRVREVEVLITEMEGPVMSVEITERTLAPRTVAAVRDTIPSYADEGRLWERLMAGMGAAGVAPAPDAWSVATFLDPEYVEEGPDVEVQLDVATPFEDTAEVQCRELPEQRVAVGTLHGSYDGMGEVMEALGGWVPEHGLRIAGPMFNRYVVGPMENPDPAGWVTEVHVPVAQA